MRVAIIGAGRSRNGIGQYIARYVHANGAQVVAVLGTAPDRAEYAAGLLRHYGINALPFVSCADMLGAARPDAVVIASPAETHRAYLDQCLQAGVHIFCEKPFVWKGRGDTAAWLRDFFVAAEARGLTVGMNSQWPFVLPYYERLCGRLDALPIEALYMRMSPISSGREMIPDALPHALSMLFCAAGRGDISTLAVDRSSDMMNIDFTYGCAAGSIHTRIELVREQLQPRTFCFGFNNRVVSRSIDMSSYAMTFTCGDEQIAVPDPLELSVQDFLDALQDRRPPRINAQHITATTVLLQDVYDACTAT